MEITREEAQLLYQIIEAGNFSGQGVIEVAKMKVKLAQCLRGPSVVPEPSEPEEDVPDQP